MLEPIIFEPKWTPRGKCYLQVKIGDVTIATSKTNYNSLDEATIAARVTLDALNEDNVQPFNETFVRSQQSARFQILDGPEGYEGFDKDLLAALDSEWEEGRARAE